MMDRRRLLRKRSSLVAATLALVAAGCPARFDPRAEPITVASADPAAAEAYRAARARLDAREPAAAEAGFARFVEQFPRDPLVPAARLWQARAAFDQGADERARPLLAPLTSTEDAVGLRARFLEGLVLARQGDREAAAQALARLRPFVETVRDGADAVELHASLAAAAAVVGDHDLALREYEAFYQGASEAERRHIRLRVVELGRPLDEAARRRFGLDVPAAGGRATGSAVGLVLPLSGRNRLIGEHALRGALLAASAIPPSPSTVELRLRDTQSRPERAAAAVDALVAEGVAAIVGSPDRAEAAAAIPRAEAAGVPYLALSPDAAGQGRVFRVVRPNAIRAEALAEAAAARGCRRVVSVFPEGPYGRRMAEAFAAAARARAVQVVAEHAFDEKTTTFISLVKRVAEARPDAVFVPALVGQVELLAAQLYAAGVTRAQGVPGKPARPSGKAALLLATADGATPRLLASSGRHLQGALLAPAFYPDAADPVIGPFVSSFRDLFGEDPGAAEALAGDALRAVIAARREGGSLAERLVATSRDLGATGPLAFGPDGERRGAALVFVVESDAIHAVR